ncbi:MAG: exonuclease domain-containing protein [Christensenellales bacterium]
MFVDEINRLTQNKFDFLRFNKAVVDKDNATVELNFVISKDIDDNVWNKESAAELEDVCRQLLPATFKLKFKYIKTEIDPDVIKRIVKDYFAKNNRALIGQYDESALKIQTNNNKVRIVIPAYDYICEYCIKAGVKEALQEYIDSNIVADVKIEFLPIGKQGTTTIAVKPEEVYVDRGLVNVSSKLAIMGNGVDLRPKYISRYDKPKADVCVAGRVSDFSRNISSKGYIYYKFTLDDGTGSINCVAFSRGKKHGPLDCVENDKCLAVQGELAEDNYRKGLVLRVIKADMCQVDFDGIIESVKTAKEMEKKKNKAVVMPMVKHGYINLFDGENCQLLKENNVVVFDLETTGTDPVNDRIIEIGAVKISDGEIVSYYETFVDPKMKIPAAASQVNHIYDQDVADAPYIEDCLGDFIDYCKDCVVVAHNGFGFDFLFIKRECQTLGYSFDNRLMDTLEMARKAYPVASTPKLRNHRLGTLCNFLDIELTNAHRAYYDAEATAKLFIKLANTLNLQ